MKKTSADRSKKPLTFNAETLRNIDDRRLGDAAGGSAQTAPGVLKFKSIESCDI